MSGVRKPHGCQIVSRTPKEYDDYRDEIKMRQEKAATVELQQKYIAVVDRAVRQTIRRKKCTAHVVFPNNDVLVGKVIDVAFTKGVRGTTSRPSHYLRMPFLPRCIRVDISI